MTTFVVAGSRPWNREAFDRHAPALPGDWLFIRRPEALTLEALREADPRYVFFIHWSWIVPEPIVEAFECVVFHMTDVPYGRGGSPLQNLIARGHRETVMSALRMTAEVDAGPVYLKRPLSLEGSAREIYERATELSFDMIREILEAKPEPTPQEGQVVMFHRRRPEHSELPEASMLRDVYDHIRMLDAEGYPRAFLESKGLRLELSDAILDDDRIEARVTLTRSDATPQATSDPTDPEGVGTP